MTHWHITTGGAVQSVTVRAATVTSFSQRLGRQTSSQNIIPARIFRARKMSINQVRRTHANRLTVQLDSEGASAFYTLNYDMPTLHLGTGFVDSLSFVATIIHTPESFRAKYLKLSLEENKYFVVRLQFCSIKFVINYATMDTVH
jgi:hypothetical protein